MYFVTYVVLSVFIGVIHEFCYLFVLHTAKYCTFYHCTSYFLLPAITAFILEEGINVASRCSLPSLFFGGFFIVWQSENIASCIVLRKRISSSRIRMLQKPTKAID